MRCKDCKFAEKLGSYISCRRFPPQVTYNKGMAACTTEFPEVKEYQWCGEFKQKGN